MKRRVNRFPAVLAKLFKDDSGATVIEYTLIASIISIGILASAGTLGKTVSTLYVSVAEQVTAATE
ncbi:Flp family type IVb pilin [Phyllobacterium sp. SB3]|uniref:Flp family type IVb pilin n=1 Tax=Phyllobacterium sp. SB3 TaxID=3156073 RepID=UPI0032AFB5B6